MKTIKEPKKKYRNKTQIIWPCINYRAIFIYRGEKVNWIKLFLTHFKIARGRGKTLKQSFKTAKYFANLFYRF